MPPSSTFTHQEQIKTKDLKLKLVDGEAPFALSEKENLYGPDDWAWLFLSLNEKYVAAYNAQKSSARESEWIKRANTKKKQQEWRAAKKAGAPLIRRKRVPDEDSIVPINSIDRRLDDRTLTKIAQDLDEPCRREFGLAKWLDPRDLGLPKLETNDSWFFPLKFPVWADFDRTLVDNSPHPWPPIYTYGKNFSSRSGLVTIETPFGYQTPLTIPHRDGKKIPDWQLLRVAIDCSIPPEGQIDALHILATLNRAHLRKYKFTTYDQCPEDLLSPVVRTTPFKNMRFEMNANGTEKANPPHTTWRAVTIDVLAPIKSQMKTALRLAKQFHYSLLEHGLAQPQKFSPPPVHLPFVNDKDGISRSGGNYLKALHILTQLSRSGCSLNDIAEITRTSPHNATYQRKWQEAFHSDIETYIDDGNKLVDTGYKWLIHIQKPSISPAKKQQ